MDAEKMSKKEWMEFTQQNTREMTETLGKVITAAMLAQMQVEEPPPSKEAIAKDRAERVKAMRRMFACAALQMFKIDTLDLDRDSMADEISKMSWKVADRMMAYSDLPPEV